MQHILPTDIVNKTLTYLATKPYSEVVALIRDIQSQAKPYSEIPQVEEKIKDDVCQESSC